MSQPPQAMGVLMSFCGGKIYKREIWAISWSLLVSELRLQYSGVLKELEATQNWLNLMMNPVNDLVPGTQFLIKLGCSLCYSDSQMI